MQTVRPALSPEFIWFTILFNVTVQTSLLAWYQLRPNLFVLVLLVLWNLLLSIYFTKTLHLGLKSLRLPRWQLWAYHFLATMPYLGAALILLLMMKDPLKRHPQFLRRFFWATVVFVVIFFPHQEKDHQLLPYASTVDHKIITHAPHSISYLYLSWLEGRGDGQSERREAAAIERTHTLWGLNRLIKAKAELNPDYPNQARAYWRKKPLSAWPLPLGITLVRGSMAYSLHLFAQHLYLHQ